MAVNGMRTFFLSDGGLAATWLVTAVVAGTAVLACSSDPATSEDSTSTGGSNTTNPSSGTTSPNTTGANTTNTTGTSAGTTGATSGQTTGTTGGQTTGATGGQTTGDSTTTTGSGGSGTSGSGTTGVASGDCGITVGSYELSPMISTVGIVTWSAAGTLDSAQIHFGPAGSAGFTMTAPVDLAEPDYRTLLLGMKPDSEYQFQIEAKAGDETCTSEMLTLTTGTASNSVPQVTQQIEQEGAAAPGFYVTVGYGANTTAFIFDKDGDPVWWAPAPNNASGVRMDYEGKAVWIVTGNPSASGMGQIRRVSMDGTQVDNLPSSYDGHHDLAPLPGGSVAALIHSGGNCASIIEVHADMSVTDIVPDVSTIYTPVQQCHPNAILYHPEDDSFTVSDRNPNLYVKISREGEVQWQFGGNNPLGPHIQQSWNVNHGHHLLPNGNFLFFNNNGTSSSAQTSPVVEFDLDIDGLTATEVWRHSTQNMGTGSLGDVQRLSNGNTLITYSNAGAVHEVDADKNLVQSFQTDPLGYLMHRESLYGPPPK